MDKENKNEVSFRYSVLVHVIVLSLLAVSLFFLIRFINFNLLTKDKLHVLLLLISLGFIYFIIMLTVSIIHNLTFYIVLSGEYIKMYSSMKKKQKLIYWKDVVEISNNPIKDNSKQNNKCIITEKNRFVRVETLSNSMVLSIENLIRKKDFINMINGQVSSLPN